MRMLTIVPLYGNCLCDFAKSPLVGHGQRWSMSPLQYTKHLFDIIVFCCTCKRVLTTSSGVTEIEDNRHELLNEQVTSFLRKLEGRLEGNILFSVSLWKHIRHTNSFWVHKAISSGWAIGGVVVNDIGELNIDSELAIISKLICSRYRYVIW